MNAGGTAVPGASPIWLWPAASIAACGYVVLMTEPLFHGWFPDLWPYGKSLGNRAGIEGPTDFVLGVVGLLLVLEATRRSIGWVVPALAVLFLAHSFYGHLAHQNLLPDLPGWLLPHGGQDAAYLVSTTFSQSLGVLGPAAGVMFKYVFLFVIFGAFLEMSGATQFIIDFAHRVFGGTPGGPAKVAVLGSGLMGSLSGSAVANAVTTGTFTIPMMRHAGFERHVAGGITAAAASGGALVPPVMGAGAYMMLELVQPQVTFLQVAKAALIPAILYYLSIFLIVHFHARRAGAAAADRGPARPISRFQGLIFFSALGTLILFLLMGFTPFKAVSGSLAVILLLSLAGTGTGLSAAPRRWALSAFALVVVLHQWILAQPPAVPKLRLYCESLINSSLVGMFGLLLFALLHPKLRPLVLEAMVKAARNGVALIAASACVGIIIGVVQSTGIATDFSNVIKSVVESSLLLALVGIMICSIVLGMGVPSVVCYLADGHLDGIAAGTDGCPALGGPSVHLLFRDDVDGDPAGGAGRLCQRLHRQGQNHEDGTGLLPFRPGRLHLAFHVRLPARAAAAGAAGYQQSPQRSDHHQRLPGFDPAWQSVGAGTGSGYGHSGHLRAGGRHCRASQAPPQAGPAIDPLRRGCLPCCLRTFWFRVTTWVPA